MEAISNRDIQKRIERDNPWWGKENFEFQEARYPRRSYFEPFKKLSLNYSVRRATILLGPRRVGKTFMIKQLLSEAISEGLSPKSVMYVSIDTPVYSGLSLERLVSFLPSIDSNSQFLVILDEIQYLRDWEVHLKDLVDTYPQIKFVASGSAAAALQLKSRESGAGRFSDFMLPPLTFYEFLVFLDEGDNYISKKSQDTPDGANVLAQFHIKDIEGLNRRFIDYLNFGGYPEAVLNQEIRDNPEQFIKNDIIDKVLLKDLPSLYGIHEIQELNRLFSFLAFNSGNEASLEHISQESGLAKPTIKKYIECLESAFLIIKISTIDDNCSTMKRERNFKIYLNNPSMRAALFAPVEAEDTQKIGLLAESAVFGQWQHSPNFGRLRYARWRNEGEVDIVYLSGPSEKPLWVGEVKWSDRADRSPEHEARHILNLVRKHASITGAFLTTKSYFGSIDAGRLEVSLRPTAAYCYIVGRNITTNLEALSKIT